MKQILIETQQFQPSSIDTINGKLVVQGKIQAANTPNQNGRIYPKHILDREIQKYLQNEVAQRRAYGELDHPETSVVNLKNVCWNIVDIWWDGDDVIGKLEILGTPSGNILKTLFEGKYTVGISSRGVGSVTQLVESDNPNIDYIEPDFELICWDAVSTPSTHGAFLKQVSGVTESKVIKTINETDNKINELIHDLICEMSGKCCVNF